MLEKTMDYVALDLETTGLSPHDDMIIEIGAVKVIGGSRVDKFSTFVLEWQTQFFDSQQLLFFLGSPESLY